MLRVRNALPLATLNAFKVGWQLCLLFRTFPAVDKLNHPRKLFHTDNRDLQRSKPPRESGTSRNKFGVSSRKDSTVDTGQMFELHSFIVGWIRRIALYDKMT
jgi:hypothetical protein